MVQIMGGRGGGIDCRGVIRTLGTCTVKWCNRFDLSSSIEMTFNKQGAVRILRLHSLKHKLTPDWVPFTAWRKP